MKLADRTVEIHSKGVASSNQFSIAQTSKMFKILSDSLYSDKVMAVIRELSTNAYDAHVAAGNKSPFKVTLPTQASPSFIVRDYGTGLSQQDMEELYTTYGASNKNDSNDYVGCLGLGSKSPFAYTKSFTTASYHNGKKYSYIAAMDENGVPSLSLFNISDTNEPNGLEISFAVKNHDFHEFSTKAKRIYHYFKSKPIIEGGVHDDLANHEYSFSNIVIEGKGWRIGRYSTDSSKYPSSHNNADSGIVAIMGNIAYPVESSKIIGEDKPEQTDAIQAWNRAFGKVDVDNWKNLVKEVLGSGLYLEIQFGIGDLEMDVSREGLQYTKQVIKTLREKTQDIYLQLKEDMSEKLKTATNLVSAYQTYYNLSDLAGGWTAGAAWTDPNGKVHELQSGKDLEYKFKKNKQFYAINFRTAGYRSRRMVYLTDKIHHETLNGKGQYYWNNNYSRKAEKMVFFRCDVKSAETAKKIAIRYCNQNECFAYLMVDSDTPEDSTVGFDDIIKDIGGESNVVEISKYRDIIASNSTRKSRGSTGTISKDEIFAIVDLGATKNCKELGGNGINDSMFLRELSDDLVEYIEDEDNEIVYIPILRYGSVEGFPAINQITSLSKNENIALGKKLFDSQKVFAIKQSSVEKLKNDGINLVNFNEWFKKYATKMISKLTEKVSFYKDIMDYADSQFNAKDPSFSDRYYYNSAHSDRQIMHHIVNLFGMDYRKYIKNESFCEILDQWFMIEFFADTITKSKFDIPRFTKDDYFAKLAVILNKYGMNGIDPSDIRDNTLALNYLNSTITTLYGDETNPVSNTIKNDKGSSDIISKLPKMNDIRKNLKAEVDKVPMLKYIIGSVTNNGHIRNITSNNPLKIHDSGYGGKQDWFNNLGGETGIESFKQTLGSLI